MAKLDLSVNVPDEQLPRLQAALRQYFGKIEDGQDLRDRTNPELVTALRGMVVAQLKDIARGHEWQQVMMAANVKDIDAN